MTGVHGQGSFAAAHFDFSRAFLPHTEATWGIQPIFIEQPQHFFVATARGTSTRSRCSSRSGFRHQFRAESANTRPYVEIGSGPLWSNKRVPATSAHVNFDSYGTVGTTFHARNGYAPYAGFRFQHISNAGIVADRNPGYNIGSIVIGVRLVR